MSGGARGAGRTSREVAARSPWMIILACAIGVMVACSSSDQTPALSHAAGTERGPCLDGGVCNDGLVCLSNTCVFNPASASGGAGSSGASSNGGSGSSGASSSGGATNDSGGATSGGAPSGGHADASIDGAGRDGGAATGGSTGSGGTTGSGGASGAGGIGTGGTCSSTGQPLSTLPLDVYVLLDQSLSMNDTVNGGPKWDLITGALKQFVQSPSSSGVSLGLGYFPLVVPNAPPSCFQDSDCGSYGPCDTQTMLCEKSNACRKENYSPDVPISLLPGAGPAIGQSLAAHSPGGFTPTYPALQATFDYVKGWADAHPYDQTIVVLATDGDPTTCDSNNNVATIASNLVAPALIGSPSIQTFVIGVGSSLTSLNQIAAAGGTQQAFIVNTAADAGAQFLDAMTAIVQSNLLDCEYRIQPLGDAGPLDPSLTNVRLSPVSPAPEILHGVANAAGCIPTEGGWYFDDPQQPSKIILCTSTCSRVHEGWSVDLLLGCPTKH